MNLQKKTENHPQKKQQVPVANSYNRAAYEEDVSRLLPHGKFKGRSLQYIKDNEQWYYRYMQENDLISKWNLEKIKNIQIVTSKPKWDPFRAGNGKLWMGIICTPAE